MDDLVDEKLLRRTFFLARLAKNRGNGPFGALLAQGSHVVFEAENTVTEGNGDLTCHAEMNLLREASAFYGKENFSKLTMYCSTEPCPMCAGAAYFCGVGRIVYGRSGLDYCQEQGAGIAMGCRDVFGRAINCTIEVVGPMLESEASELGS